MTAPLYTGSIRKMTDLCFVSTYFSFRKSFHDVEIVETWLGRHRGDWCIWGCKYIFIRGNVSIALGVH